MELPAALRQGVDEVLDGVSLTEIKKAARTLSDRYRAEVRDGRLHMAADLSVHAYLATRLPATYAAVRASLYAAREAAPGFTPHTLLDVGSGPGTALWGAADVWPDLEQATLLEASDPARRIGKSLSAALSRITTDWLAGDVTIDMRGLQPHDLVTCAYVLDEIAPAALPTLIDRLWQLTAGMLVVVEPGTPAGWRRIIDVRTRLIEAGATIAAPCPHHAPCPLTPPDWCHFAQRVARSRVHRLAKDADVPWEDEKFIYLAATRAPVTDRASRVLAPPRAGSGKVQLKLCREDGTVAEQLFTKRDGQPFKIARRLDWGDTGAE